MPSTRDIRRRIKSVKNTRQITKALELVAASKMKKAQQAALAGRPYAELMARMLAALADRVEESQHEFLVKRPVKTRGIILITSDMGLCGPLNSNLFKLVTEITTPAKFAVIGRSAARSSSPAPTATCSQTSRQGHRQVFRHQGRGRIHGETVPGWHRRHR